MGIMIEERCGEETVRETGGSQCQVCDLSRRSRVLVVCYFTNTLEWVKSGCQICFRQRRSSKKSLFTITTCLRTQPCIEYLIFSYDIIFSYYILRYQNMYIYTYIRGNVSYKRNYTDIGLPSNRSVKLPEEASKPSPVHTNLPNQNYVDKNSSYRARVYNSLASILSSEIT